MRGRWVCGLAKWRSRLRGMFCPVCKAEYRRGFTRCSDCDVDLVRELPKRPGEGERGLDSAWDSDGDEALRVIALSD